MRAPPLVSHPELASAAKPLSASFGKGALIRTIAVAALQHWGPGERMQLPLTRSLAQRQPGIHATISFCTLQSFPSLPVVKSRQQGSPVDATPRVQIPSAQGRGEQTWRGRHNIQHRKSSQRPYCSHTLDFRLQPVGREESWTNFRDLVSLGRGKIDVKITVGRLIVIV